MRGLVWMVVVIALSACASQPRSETGNPKIDRISPEALAKILPQTSAKLSLEELVKLSKAGESPEQVIKKIRASDSIYDLSPSQTLELSRQGVDAKVLDFIHQQRELALQNNLADEINRREQQKQLELNKLKNRMWQQQRFYDPYCRFGRYGFSPYGFGGFGSHFGHRFGLGAGFGVPLGCW